MTTSMNGIRVLIVEDHALVREGLRVLLDGLDGVETVGEAEDGHEALGLIRETSPDVVLLDISMPVMNGLETLLRIGKSHPGVRVLMLSMHASEEYVFQALSSGASGYFLKNAGTEELDTAIRAVHRGEIYLSSEVSRSVISAYVSRNQVRVQPDPFAVLTPRQREVLQLIAESHSTKSIARKLGISVKTVETHRAKLMSRLKIRDVAGLVRYTIRTGLVLPNP
jgi:DNA-binding NarL/FixJ family response regulator